jgi:hypothetical protein
MRAGARAGFFTVAIVSATTVAASDLPTKKPAPETTPVPPLSDWHFDLTLYGWGLNLTGNTGFGPFPTTPFFVSFDDLLRHLDYVVMGRFVARSDTFIGGLDLILAKVGTGATFRNPMSPLYGVGADVSLNVAIATGFGGVRIPIGPPNLSLYGVVGARYINLGDSLTLTTPVFGFSHTFSANKDWADPVAGVAANYLINDKWFLNAYVDAGGLSNSATSQGLAEVGYKWTSSISTTLGYRVLYVYDKQDNAANGSFRFQSWIYGPTAGLRYSF